MKLLKLALVICFLFLFATSAQAFGRRNKCNGATQSCATAGKLCSTCPSTNTCLSGQCATTCENGNCLPTSVQTVGSTSMIQVCENGKCRMVPANADPFVLPKSTAPIIVVYKH